MRFYNRQHKFYCGIDLHARKMYVCIISNQGRTVVHKNIKTEPEALFELIFPYLEDIVVCAECLFAWYWVKDFCDEHRIPFVLGHALYVKAIHGGNTKNDKLDSYKIATLLRGGNLPMAYAYPAKIRATRDLIRRRTCMVRQCADLLAHIQNTNTQYNHPAFAKKISRKYNRDGVAERFENPPVRSSVQADLAMIDAINKLIKQLEWQIEKLARRHCISGSSLSPHFPRGNCSISSASLVDRSSAAVIDYSSLTLWLTGRVVLAILVKPRG